MLEQFVLDPLVAATAALLGVLLGLVLGRLFLPGPREVKRLQAELDRLRREQTEYQGRVAGHFHKTGELIGQMTASYKAVYDHLADGAQSLCAAEALPKPAFSVPRLIVDETVSIGAQGAAAPARPQAEGGDPETPAMRFDEPVAPLHVVTPVEGGPAPLSQDNAIKPAPGSVSLPDDHGQG
jgi:hypothetical protein